MKYIILIDEDDCDSAFVATEFLALCETKEEVQKILNTNMGYHGNRVYHLDENNNIIQIDYYTRKFNLISKKYYLELRPHTNIN